MIHINDGRDDGFNFDEKWTLAQNQAREMLDQGLYSRFGQTYQERLEHAAIGCLGELAFQYLLSARGIQFSLDQTDFNQARTDEFDVAINGNKIDVKVVKSFKEPNPNWCFGYPEEQNPSSKDFVVVGIVNLNTRQISFYGWLEGRRISEYPVVTENSFRQYRYLTPNHEFRYGDMNQDFNELFRLCGV